MKLINCAIKSNTNLIIFPELSTTNYVPDLENELATEIKDSIFLQFQDLSDETRITIGIGKPTKIAKGIYIYISMLYS